MFVLIFSVKNDFTTNEVIEWLKLKDFKFERIGYAKLDKSPKLFLQVSNHKSQFKVDGKIIHSVWFRKGFYMSTYEKDLFEEGLENFLLEETKQYRKIMFHSTPYNMGVKVLGKNDIEYYDVNKMRTLIMAKRVGLNIPQTIVTNSKEDIVIFLGRHKKVISKPLNNPAFLASEDKRYSFSMYTSIIDDNVLEKLNDVVTPCFVQEYIEKSVELRIFFCENDYYCAAIFSQNNKKTIMDFRNYSTGPNEGNKYVPFKLLEEIKEKLVKLMDLIGLNTGSIDMILTPDGDYYFLEVNPVGQFGMISHPCNFHLEEKVANFLTS